MWYRAVVTSVVGNQRHVTMLDWGSTDVVDDARIRPIQQQFLTIPALAVKCALAGQLFCKENLLDV